MRLSQLIVLGVLLGLGPAGAPRCRRASRLAAGSTTGSRCGAGEGIRRAARHGPCPGPTAPSAARAADAPSGLLLPVQGVAASQLRDTFTDARSEGRVHDAIDILADAGTPVLAVADGTVENCSTANAAA